MIEQTRLPLESVETAMVVSEPPKEPTAGALVDLRHGAMTMPVEVMQQGLREYAERRQCFRDWLRSQLVEGVHYGHPPGTEPKLDEDGNILAWNGKKQREVMVPKKQWQSKPSFYKAGADFLCDLMGVRDEYRADNDAWQQLGSKSGTFVFGCYLYSRATGELLGEGRGVRRTGDKGGDENNAIKMAKKSSKVDAVLNTWGLADLFTQDREDDIQPPHDNPQPREDAPKVKPRGQRQNPVRDTLSVGMLKGLFCQFIGFDKSTADKDRIAEAAEDWARFKADCLGADIADANLSDEEVRQMHAALEQMEIARRNAK